MVCVKEEYFLTIDHIVCPLYRGKSVTPAATYTIHSKVVAQKFNPRDESAQELVTQANEQVAAHKKIFSNAVRIIEAAALQDGHDTEFNLREKLSDLQDRWSRLRFNSKENLSSASLLLPQITETYLAINLVVQASLKKRLETGPYVVQVSNYELSSSDSDSNSDDLGLSLF